MNFNNQLYRRPEWKSLRLQAIDLVEGQCEHCNRKATDGAVLQLHHKRYFSGRLPWEYKFNELLILCRGCHAKWHGIIMDNANWSYDGEGVDHGDLNGTCDYCGNELRYEHHVSHRNCGSLTVGSQCAENLTRSTEATDRQRFLERRSRFVKSKKWSHVDVATESIKQGKIEAAIVKLDQNGFHLEINGTAGQQSYKTAEDAKKLLFENICNGKIATFFEKAKAA